MRVIELVEILAEYGENDEVLVHDGARYLDILRHHRDMDGGAVLEAQ